MKDFVRVYVDVPVSLYDAVKSHYEVGHSEEEIESLSTEFFSKLVRYGLLYLFRLYSDI